MIKNDFSIQAFTDYKNVYFKDAKLENGAALDSTGKAKNIGGSNNGAATIEINIPVGEAGSYNFNLAFTSFGNANIFMDFKGENSSSTVKWSLGTAPLGGAITANVYLDEGINVVKFYGDASTANVYLTRVAYGGSSRDERYPLLGNGEYNLAKGTFGNGAVRSSNTGFVSNLGGVANGYIIYTFKSMDSGEYDVALEYLNTGANKFLKLDINGLSNEMRYSVNNTANNEIGNALIAKFKVSFKQGDNTIKFYGDGINGCPDIRKINLKKSLALGSYRLADGILGNGSSIDTNTGFVKNLGGVIYGFAELPVYVQKAGKYNFIGKYLSGDKDRYFTISVDGVIVDKNGHKGEKTTDWNLTSVKTITIPLTLKEGANKLTVEGFSNIDTAPYIGEFSIRELANNTLPMVTSSGVYTEGILPPTIVDSVTGITKDVYEAGKGVFAGGGRLNDGSVFAGWIGGPTDGSVTLNVRVKEEGFYNLEFEYIASDSARPLKIDVNGVDSKKIYNPPKSSGWLDNQFSIFKVKLYLNLGGYLENKIKFHGDGTNYAPSINKVYVYKEDITKDTVLTYDIFKGDLSGEAKVDDIYASYIGGPQNGEVVVKTEIPKSGRYKLTLDYRNSSRPFKIDINGVNTGTVYFFTGQYIGSFSTMIDLNVGVNSIKFYGNGTDYAPDLSKLYLKLSMANVKLFNEINYPAPVNSYEATQGQLEGGAVVDLNGKLAAALGGVKDGAVTITANVEKTGYYEIQAKYLASDSRVFKVAINGVETGNIYRPQITGITLQDAKIFNFGVVLKAGDNKIKFHGDGTTNAPSFGTISINRIAGTFPQIYSTTDIIAGTSLVLDAAKGQLAGNAKLDDGLGFAGWLGGPTDGSVTLTVNVDKAGVYNMFIQYISSDVDRPLVVDVNGVTDKTIYKTPKTDGWTVEYAKIFVIGAILKSGENKIKFHGNGVNYAPSIGEVKFYLSKIMSTEAVNLSKYDIALGSLSEGALIDESTNLITNIGGKEDISSLVSVNVDNVGYYNLVVKYLSGDTDRMLKIAINGDDFYSPHILPKTNSWALEDMGTFQTKVLLNGGVNFIKFHGDGINYGPYLGELTVQVLKEVSSGSMVLIGSAKINGSVIEGIAGEQNGIVSLSVEVPSTGIYDLAIHYIANDDNKKLKINVNGVNTQTLYNFEMTKSMDLNDEKVKLIKLPLIKGKNIIELY